MQVQVVFLGDFFQIFPVKGVPLVQEDSIKFSAIKKAIFLNKFNQFNDDPVFDRASNITNKDIQKINTHYVINDNVELPSIPQIWCKC